MDRCFYWYYLFYVTLLMRLNLKTTLKIYLLWARKFIKHDLKWFALLDELTPFNCKSVAHHMIKVWQSSIQKAFSITDFAGCISQSLVELKTALKAAHCVTKWKIWNTQLISVIISYVFMAMTSVLPHHV